MSEPQDLCRTPAAAPPTGVYNLDNPVTLAPDLIAASVITTLAATVILAGRLWHNLHHLRWSDSFAVLGYLSSLAYTINNLLMLRFARHLWDVPACLFDASYLKQVFAEETLNQIARFFIKGSILMLYQQLFSNVRWMRIAVAAGLVFDFLFYGALVAVFVYYSIPHGNQTWEELYTNGSALHTAPTGLVQGPVTILIDLYLFILPLPILWRLQMTSKRRLQIIAVFATGFLAVIAGLVTLRYLIILVHSESDSTWASTQTFVWCIVENNVSIAVGSTPAFVSFARVYIINGALFRSLTSLISRVRGGDINSVDKDPQSSKPLSIITWGRWRSDKRPGAVPRTSRDSTQPWLYELSETALNTSVSAAKTGTALADEEAAGITRTTQIDQTSRNEVSH
ncbi:hypothetical protein F4860DRAFT_525756 [Xylaria cubensis]|nr:hypothetical protein F4860DRAFT_525756 [Xylaria cubensis]